MSKQTIWSISALLSVVLFVAGCASQNGILGVDTCADISPGAIPEPAGNKLCNLEVAQVGGAFADQLVFYQSDFVGKTAKLSPAAAERISRITNMGSSDQLVWVIESSNDADLDQFRRQSVTNQLTSLGAQPLDVVVGIPTAIGLSGPQLERIATGLGSRNSSRNRNSNSNNNRSGFLTFGGN